MKRRAEVERLLRRYGVPVRAGEQSFPAVLRPLRFSSGRIPGEQLLVGPAEVSPGAGSRISAPDGDFTVVKSGSVVFGGEMLYTRAVLCPDSGNSVTVETDAGTAASAERCTAKAVRQSSGAVAFGESDPYGMETGPARYEIALGGVLPAPGTELSSLTDFRVIIRSAAGAITYSGCRWKEEAESGGSSVEFARDLTALALSKRESAAPQAKGGNGSG